MRKYLVLLCISISLVLIVSASLKYPGGSILDKDSYGFDWSKNFISNLFRDKAINGKDNPGKNWAILGMAFHSLGYGLFFLNMAGKMFNSHASKVLTIVGVLEIVFNFLIASSLHDQMVTLSSTLSLLGLFYITIFTFRTKLNWLKFSCVLCLLIFYFTLYLYGTGDWGLLAIMQKVSMILSILLILTFEFFTVKEDYLPLEKGSLRN